MSENVAPGADADCSEIGRHPLFKNLDISKRAEERYADGLRCDLLMGKVSIVITVDPNKAEVDRSLTNAPELDDVLDEMMKQLRLEGSVLRQACEKIRGSRPAVETNANSNQDGTKKRRVTGREVYLKNALSSSKLLFGSLPAAVQHNDPIRKVEEELRAYYARGNPLPRGVKHYLEQGTLREITDPLPPLGSHVSAGLDGLLPLVFDPTQPSSLSKQLFNLQQSKVGKPVTIRTKPDGRKGTEAQDRARKQLEELHKRAAEVGVSARDWAAGARGKGEIN